MCHSVCVVSAVTKYRRQVAVVVIRRSSWFVIASFTVIVGIGSISLLSSSSLRCNPFALVFGILRCCREHRWFVAAVSTGTVRDVIVLRWLLNHKGVNIAWYERRLRYPTELPLLLSSCKLVGVVTMQSR